jgi:tripartite-type tricarboxylate transporter receptor subunit TctC
MMIRHGAIATAAGIFILGSVSLSKSRADEFYKDRVLTILVGYSAGGVYDVQARILSQNIGRFIPGEPKVIVQNMPGAGSLKSANYLYKLAPQDGSYIGSFANGLITQQLFDAEGIQFDSRRFKWIGSSMSETNIVYAWHTTGFRSMADVQAREMIVPGTGSGANSVTLPRIMNAILGTKFRVVAGYPGAAETMLAIERGEAQGHAGGTLTNLKASKPTWLAEGKVRILGQLSLKKHPDLEDTPLIVEMVTNPQDRAALQLMLAKQSVAFPLAAPPDTPSERLDVLRRAFVQTVNDNSFKGAAAKFNIELDLTTGEEIESLVKLIFDTPSHVVVRARTLIASAQK